MIAPGSRSQTFPGVSRPIVYGQRFGSFINTEAESIPAYAAMEVVGVDKEDTLYVRKPTKDDDPNVLLNGSSVVPANGSGRITNHLPTWAYYHDADGTPANAESLGTRAGYWELFRGYEGFLVWGGAAPVQCRRRRKITPKNPISPGTQLSLQKLMRELNT